MLRRQVGGKVPKCDKWNSSWYIGTKIEEIDDELVIKLSVWKKKSKSVTNLVWSTHLEITDREKEGIERKCNFINYFIVSWDLCSVRRLSVSLSSIVHMDNVSQFRLLLNRHRNFSKTNKQNKKYVILKSRCKNIPSNTCIQCVICILHVIACTSWVSMGIICFKTKGVFWTRNNCSMSQ